MHDLLFSASGYELHILVRPSLTIMSLGPRLPGIGSGIIKNMSTRVIDVVMARGARYMYTCIVYIVYLRCLPLNSKAMNFKMKTRVLCIAAIVAIGLFYHMLKLYRFPTTLRIVGMVYCIYNACNK